MAPKACIDIKKHYTATMKTDVGTITIRLLPAQAPKTVNNFVFLARQGYYDGTPFHRTIAGFMIQGGDPTGTGTGGPGYTFEDEFNDHKVVRGALAMANAGPNTNGSQFFIVHGDGARGLPPNYTIFGRVTSGMDVVNAIATAPVRPGGREASSPVNPVTINSVTIAEQ